MSTSHSASLTLSDGTSFDLGASCSLGRASANEIVLSGQKVSRRHAVIHQQGSREFWLIDLGSSNGTLVNDHPVIQPMPLEEQDRITVGGNTLVFHGPKTSPGLSVDDTLAASTLKQTNVLSKWLLLADLAGFTPLSQTLPPDELARVVGKWFFDCRRIVDTHKGQVNKYLGDGFLAVWPDSPTTEQNVARTLEELDALKSECDLSFRLALHYGEVSMGRVVDGGEMGMMGPDLNFLFRMEKLGADLNVACLLSESVCAQMASSSLYKETGRHSLKGFEGTYPFFAWEPGIA